MPPSLALPRVSPGASTGGGGVDLPADAIRRAIVGGSVAVAILAGWSARSLILDLQSPGPLVIVLTGSLALVVAILATWIPALTASRAEPGLLLRSE